MAIQDARAAGYIRAVTFEGGCYCLALLVKPEADLDGRFKAYDTDEGEFLWVNGWTGITEEGH